MKTRIFTVFFLFIALMAFADDFTVTFNTTTDLSDYFFGDMFYDMTNVSSGGLENTGCVSIPSGCNDVWTTQNTFSRPGVDEYLTVIGYFLISANDGYCGLGASPIVPNESSEGDCHVSNHGTLGVRFNGSGGSFFYGQYSTDSIDFNWSGHAGNLQLGNWYCFAFSIMGTGTAQFELGLTVWNSDVNGTKGAIFDTQSSTVYNETIAFFNPDLYAYFAASGNQATVFDQFSVNNAPVTLPVTLSSFTAALTSTFDSVTLNWEVESEHDHLGYNVLRSSDGNLDSAVKVNSIIIATDNETGGAASYNYRDTEIEQDYTYSYWLESIDLDGTVSMYGPATVTITGEAEEPGDTPEVTFTTGIDNIYPNPFNPNTTVQFSLEKTSEITVSVYNVRGSLVRTLEKGTFVEGSHTVFLGWRRQLR